MTVYEVNHTEAPSPEAFRAAMGDLPAAVSIVTTVDSHGAPHGATVSAISSLSMTPPLLLVCLDAGSDTLAALEPNRSFLTHIVAEGQEATAFSFAKKGQEKFSSAPWGFSATGQPKIEGAAIVFECTVTDLLPGGDHTIVVGRIEHIDHAPDRAPVIYHRRQMLPSPACTPSTLSAPTTEARS